jgi:threonine/homoserine/homoserine lactone efflux protein
MSDPLLYVLAVLTLLGTPGPTNTLLATSGAMAGTKRSLPLLIGEIAGYLIAIAVLRLVLGPVFAAYPPVGVALKLAVAAYLAWIAIRLWLRGVELTEAARTVTLSNVFVTTLLNPKALIFSLSIIPTEHPELVWYIAGFTAMVIAAGFSWIVIGHVAGRAAGDRHAVIVPRVASVALIGFAVLIVASAFR